MNDLIKGFMDEILDYLKQGENDNFQDIKHYIVNSIVYNKYFIAIYSIVVMNLILSIIILIVLLLKIQK